MKHILLYTLVLSCTIVAQAQPKVTNLDANPSGKSIALTYDLSEDANVSFFVSQNNGQSYRKISKDFLSGECGSRVKAGEHRKALWHVLDENNNEDFHGNVKFRAKVFPCFNPFVLAVGGFSTTKDWSAGLMAGMCGVAGFYVKGATNFAANKKCDYTCGANGQISYQGEQILPFYSGKQSTNNWMVTAGTMVRMYVPLYLYIGGGYGQRNLYWELNGGGWVNNDAYSYRGFAGDIGLMGNIKHVAISIGVSSINFKYTECQIGIGYML